MRKKIYGVLAVAACAVMLSSCASVGTKAGMGSLYTGVTSGATATGNELGTRVGQSTAFNAFGIVAVGDAGINAAAKNAGIKKISHVDEQKQSILGIITLYKTTVYGE